MEGLGVDATFWRGRRVFVTGVTGFKGSWLALWLNELGAIVRGYSLPPPTVPSLFELARVGDAVPWTEGDVRDGDALVQALEAFAPEFVFHLAAQPLVRRSYEEPLETLQVNIIGTANVLEAVRHCPAVRTVVVVTTDKCYENREWLWPYRETDPLGGHDPYSSSKACAEIVTASYQRSFLGSRGVGIATARAGNVIGGGDWATDRLIPDAISALVAKRSIAVRSPRSVRPWQHVLDPVAGYLVLAQALSANPPAFSEAWNFGPSVDSVQPVARVIERVCAVWGDGASWHSPQVDQPHEAKLLSLDASKARARLDWRPRLTLDQALRWCVAWYKAHQLGKDMRECTIQQVRAYTQQGPE